MMAVFLSNPSNPGHSQNRRPADRDMDFKVQPGRWFRSPTGNTSRPPGRIPRFFAKKSSVLRELIEKGRKFKSLELFKQRKVSLGLGAKLAGLTVSEYLDLLEENKIQLNLSTRENSTSN